MESIITNDWWFKNSLDICSHLTAQCNPRMSYTPLVSNDINKTHEDRTAKQLVICNSMHLLVCKPKSVEVVSHKCLCDCPSCLNLYFDQINTGLVINMSSQDDRSLDNEEDEEQKLFEFVDVHSFAVGSNHRCQVHRLPVSGARSQVLGVQVPGVRCQKPGVRCQIPCAMPRVSGAGEQVARDHVSGFKDQVSCQTVNSFHIKNILPLNRNYKLVLHLTGNYELILCLNENYKHIFHYANIFFSTFLQNKEKKPSYPQCPFRYFSRF